MAATPSRGAALRPHEIVLALAASVLVTAALFHEVTVGGATAASAPHIAFTLPTGPVGYQRPHAHPHADAAGPGWIHEANFPYRHAAFRAGELPFWHPGEACGNPYLAGLLPGLFFPTNLLMHVGTPPLGFDLAYLARIALAGWFLYLFLRVHRLRPLAAATGGLLYLGSGYLLTSLNLANAAVECCIPGLLLGVECVIARHRWRDILLATALVFAVLTGGNPQATFLALVCAGLYAFARLLAVACGTGSSTAGAAGGGLRAARHAAGALVIAHLAGALLAAPQWLPFVAFLGESAHLHQPGLGLINCAWQVVPQWVVPEFYRAALGRAAAGHHHFYLGVMPIVLAAAALGGRNHRLLRRLALGGFVLAATWYFGMPGVRLLGTLPGLSQIDLSKYLGAYPGLFAAILAALGMQRLLTTGACKGAAVRIVLGALAALAVPVTFTLLWLGGHLSGLASGQLRIGMDDPVVPTFTPGVFVIAAAIALAAIVLARPRRLRAAALGFALLTAVAVYLDRPGPWPPRREVFRPPSFLSALEGDPRTYRVYAPDAVLTPNTAGAFGLRDIRYAEALKLESYAAWIAEAFDYPDAYNYFPVPGRRPPVPLRALSLLGVRYVLCKGQLAPLRPARLSAGTIRRWPLRGDGEASRFSARLVPGDGPAHARLFTVDERAPVLVPAVPLPPGQGRDIVLDLPAGAPGPSVISLGLDSAGRGEAAVSALSWCARDLDPRRLVDSTYHRFGSRIEADRARIRTPNVITLDVGERPAAAPARLRFRLENTGQSPLRVGLVAMPARSLGTLTADVARRMELLVPARSTAGGLLVQVEGGALEAPALAPAALAPPRRFGKVSVQENPRALPRAYGVHRAESALDDAAARARVLDPDFDYQRAVVIAPAAAGLALPAQIPRRTPRVVLREEAPGGARLVFDAAFDADGLLVVLDNHAPGWRAEVDGKAAPILRANGSFRAVAVPAGVHQVVFTYVPPGWRAGLCGAAIGLIWLALLGLRARRRGAR